VEEIKRRKDRDEGKKQLKRSPQLRAAVEEIKRRKDQIEGKKK
jgi:hypothetical protein